MATAPMVLQDLGIKCSCETIIPVLVEDIPRPGIYVCYGCGDRIKITVTSKEDSDEDEE